MKRKLFDGGPDGEKIDGTKGNDLIYGNGGNDKLIGHPGDDKIFGGTGGDVIFGGQDHDELTGGKGNDKFGFNSLLAIDSDTIFDFKHGADRLIFDHHVFDEYRRPGPVSADDFVLGTAAHDKSDHFIYDKETGNLFYDPDGSGSEDKILMATLDNKANLSASDIFIF